MLNKVLIKIKCINETNIPISIYYSIFIILVFNTFIINNLNNKKLKLYNKNDELMEYINQVQKIFKEDYNIFNIKININEKELSEMIKNTFLDYTPVLDYNNLINEIFEWYLTNENLLDIKDNIKYYNNELLNNWMVNLIELNTNHSILDGNVKINSFLDKFNTNNKYGIQTNEYIYEIILIQNFIKNNFRINNIVNRNILYDSIKLSNNLFDIIYFDFPYDIHNIIYKHCCDQIKSLKIRGTNSSCLLLQSISLYLKTNGSAVLIIPENILYNTSKQVIETRKYIYDNFNIQKIVYIDQNIYYNNIKRDLKSITNTMKNCIFYFSNNGRTKNINITKINLENDKIIEKDVYNIKDINNDYSFYYKDYFILSKNPTIIDKYTKVYNIFNIYDYDKFKSTLNNNHVIILNKNYNINNFIKIVNKIETENYTNCYLIQQSNTESNNAYDHYLMNLIIKNIDNFIKGKNNEIDIEKIKDFDILNLSQNTQNTINNYIITSDKLITSNNENIIMNNILKKAILDNIPNNNMIILEKIVDLIQEEINTFSISIIKNSLLAGEVSLYQGKLNNNSYYLIPKNNDFILEYIYNYLKYKEPKIKEMSRLTQQYNLIKSKLLNIDIPNIDIKLQNEIVNYCKEFDNNIKSLESNNESIKNKDIFEIILKINSY